MSPKTATDPLTGVRAATPKDRSRNGAATRASSKKRGSPEEVVKSSRGIILDIGCGDAESKYPNAVGMDKQDLPGVDVVHDWNVFPWPFEDGSVLTIIASHVVEHVNPADGGFIRWMDEAWRVLRPNGQIAIVTPYGSSSYYLQDPTHCNPCSERTVWYFDPGHPSAYYVFYRPRPWWIEQNTFSVEGMIEWVLRKREDDPVYQTMTTRDIPIFGTGA